MKKLLLRAGLSLCGALCVANVHADINTTCSATLSSPKAAEISKYTTATSTAIQVNVLSVAPVTIGGWELAYGPIPKAATTTVALTACTKNGAVIVPATTAVAGDVISCPIAALPVTSTGIEVALFDAVGGAASGVGIIDIHQFLTACTAGKGTYWKPPTGAAGCAPVLQATACTTFLPPIAEFRFDEAVSGTVADSSGNNLNGSLSGGVTVGGIGKVCGSYNFDGSSAFVSVPNNALLNQPAVTATAWVRHSVLASASKAWETILAKGDTTYRLHLNGGCSINAPNTPNAFSFGINSGCATADADSAVLPTLNQWHHVVGTYDGVTINIYVDGVLKASGAYAGAIGSNTFPLYIGENAQQSGRFWSGDIDEVKIFGAALTAAQVGTIYANENAGKSWDGTARICPAPHIAISAPATGMTFVAEPVVITPHTATHTAATGGGTVVLSASTGKGDWAIGTGTGTLTPGAANSGSATYVFGPGETSVTLDFTYQTAATVTLNVKDTGGVDLLLNTPVAEKANTIVFTAPSFVFTNSACVNGVVFGATGQTCMLATWASQTAGMNSANVFITAVNASGVPTRLHQTKARTRNMQFGLSCHDPVANAGKQATFAGATLPLCQANGATPVAWSAIAAVTFNANMPSSNASYSFNYADVGKVELWMQNSATTTQIGSSGAFVVKPGGFVLSNIVRSRDGLANPAAANAAGAAFVGAGAAFGATVTATTCTPASALCTVAGAITPNYGKEVTPESVKLTANNVIAGMVAPAPVIGGTFGAFGATHPSGTPGVAGVAHGTAFTWDEVGIITLTPSVGDGSYLGDGDVAGTISGNVGRFYPDHFDTAVVLSAGVPMACPTNFPAGVNCPTSYNGFAYSGQPFSLEVTAKSASGATTRNYNTTTGFAKTVSLGAFGALGTTTALTGVGVLGVTSVTAFTAGMLTETAEKYTFSTAPTAPTNIYIRAEDGEASSMRATNPTTTSIEGGVAIVSGRIKVSNAYGSELLPLALMATAQYYTSTGWVNSITDSVTSLTFAASYDVFKNGAKTGTTVPAPTGATALNAGGRNIVLAKPAGGATGTATINPTAPSYLPVTSGTATFGVYKGNNTYIYRREN